jgi:hypothetical protein
VQNRNAEPHPFRLSVAGAAHDLRLGVQGEDAAAILIPADRTKELRIYLTAPAGHGSRGRTDVRLWVEDLITRERSAYDTFFQGPEE